MIEPRNTLRRTRLLRTLLLPTKLLDRTRKRQQANHRDRRRARGIRPVIPRPRRRALQRRRFCWSTRWTFSSAKISTDKLITRQSTSMCPRLPIFFGPCGGCAQIRHETGTAC
eukprot:295388-Rhodomonas_salina.1